MSLTNKAEQRFLYLDSVRAIAAIYVLWHHAVLQYYLVEPANISAMERLILNLLSDGHLAVDLFIVLSGFSLMLAATKNGHQLKGGSMLFFKRRILRIVPAYYATILLALILTDTLIGKKTGTIWDFSIPVTARDMVTHLFFVHDFFLSTSPKISYSLWSISVEFRLYLFFPFLIWIWRKNGARAALSFAAITTLITSFVLIVLKGISPDVNLIRPGISPYIILFTLGMFVADLSLSTTKAATSIRLFCSKVNPLILILAFAFSFLVYKVVPEFIRSSSVPAAYREFIAEEARDILFGLIAAFFLLLCAVNPPSAQRRPWLISFLDWRPLAFAGTFSYSLYLIHPALLQLLSQYTLSGVHVPLFGKTCLLLIVGTPIILLAAYLFSLAFEKPFLAMSKKRQNNHMEISAIENPAP